KQTVQIKFVLVGPDVSIGARVNELRIHMDPRSSFPHASLQHMGDPKGFSDLANVPFASIFHHAGAADYFQVGHLRQLGQNVVLNTVGKRRVLFLGAKIFKWQNGDSSSWRGTKQ